MKLIRVLIVSAVVAGALGVAGLSAAGSALLKSASVTRAANGIAQSLHGSKVSLDWQVGRTDEVPFIASRTGLGIIRQKDIYAPFDVQLYLSVNDSRVTKCAANSVWRWAIKGKPVGARVLLGPLSPGCKSVIVVDKQGAYGIEAKQYVKSKLVQTVSANVKVRDLLLIAMGDSNGSGEGDPPFWFDQCNRGSASYQYQTAQLLERQSKMHTSATFVSASCSGARISHLINTPYEGINPGAPVPPQITQIKSALRPPAGQSRRKVDAAMISVGVNDIAFGPILEYCIKHPGRACEDLPTRAEPATGPVQQFVGDSRSKQTLGDIIDGLVRQLPSKYAQLSTALAASHLVKPSQVYLTQYPSFFYADQSGNICTFFQGLNTIWGSTWKWLAFEANKLNHAVLNAGAVYGWNAVQVPRQLFFGHGYCSNDSWFVSLVKAKGYNWNQAGAFHPTARGAHVTAVLTVQDMCPLLANRRFCTTFPTP
jgi:GDSL-like Lipase/Acylhydrolase family